MKIALLLALAAVLCAQQETAPKPAAPPAPPTPRQRARLILDGAAEAAGQARADMQAVVLMHVADNYREIDRKKALEYFQQAFAATASIPASVKEDDRSDIQARVVELVATLDEDAAVALLQQITPAGNVDPRVEAIEKIVSMMVAKSRLDDALKLMEGLGASTATFPYRGMKTVLAKLPDDDPRVVVGFGAAMAGFANRPGRGFSDLLLANWKRIPRAMARSSATSLVKSILERPGGGTVETHIVASGGSVTLATRQESELFNVMGMLGELDAPRAREILQSMPNLRAAVERFPDGRASMGGGLGETIYRNGSGGSRTQADDEAASRARAIAEAAKDDIENAGGLLQKMVDDQPDSPQTAEAVVGLMSVISEKYPDAKDAGKAIGVAAEMVSELDAVTGAPQWKPLIESAHRVHDEELTKRIVEKGLAACAELLSRDTNPDGPNSALREYWGSTHFYREIVAAAVKAMGADAEPLLKDVSDPDVALLVRIELAQVLMGRDPTPQLKYVIVGKSSTATVR